MQHYTGTTIGDFTCNPHLNHQPVKCENIVIFKVHKIKCFCEKIFHRTTNDTLFKEYFFYIKKNLSSGKNDIQL